MEPLSKEGAVAGVISTAVDVTARKRHEIELTELLRELTHRSKNLLAVVQGIARQTGQSTCSVAEFNERFAARLQALSLAHELLVASSWRGIELRALVEGVLRSVAPDRFAQCRRRRTVAAELSPDAAQSLVIALHEMASNAAAHGALGDDRRQIAGRLEIRDEFGGRSPSSEWSGAKAAVQKARRFRREDLDFPSSRSCCRAPSTEYRT